MNDTEILKQPELYQDLCLKSKEIGFTMPSDVYVGNLLKTLVSSKPKGHFLELGTGVGLSLSWMVDGMDSDSTLVSIDNEDELIAIAQDFFGYDDRVTLICEDGIEWINSYSGKSFDLVFADAWPGKYSEIEKVLSLIALGGFYIIDDMARQPNWPEGHEKNVNRLVHYLEHRSDFTLTKMNWSTGLIIAVRTNKM
ncbi:O-methyltransferase [Pareuzebyella sediminis]|uniref:O-methyltransferase n=1 Tax=Pareuzebyella sediminis TaxID=2607998 RepID=UPI0011F004B8|nr:class I SAM-dependent methyltransferase [Pareuzebyella sediminis]